MTDSTALQDDYIKGTEAQVYGRITDIVHSDDMVAIIINPYNTVYLMGDDMKYADSLGVGDNVYFRGSISNIKAFGITRK